ncbi:MAG: PilT/PilU family type 4a pilus ATPase [Nitrospiraceae bacterium]|nr:PilT/PilU family type 4a pilus ATPase [Nitrospiraceae bacterium]
MSQEKKVGKKLKLGELLVQYGIITEEMLGKALKRQSQAGGQIGSILIELGHLSTDTLLEFLSKQMGVPAANLCKLDISPGVLRALPIEKIKEYKVLPLEVDKQFTLAMVNPTDFMTIRDIEFILGQKVNPVVVTAAQMEAALRSLEKEGAGEIRGSNIEKRTARREAAEKADMRTFLRRLSETEASDLQLTAGAPPSLKMGRELVRMNMPPLTPLQMSFYAREIMSEEQEKKFDAASDLDFAFTDPEFGRFRVNIYKQRNSVSITIRHIKDMIPGLRDLGLAEDLEPFILKNQGLVLITGPAGHGKSTTMASFVDIINTKRKCNIITLEDPIEFLHRHKNSNVNQREIGIDTGSFPEGLRHIFRQDPDVIVVGEMRDPESFRIALQAAETGHLVLSTLHSRNATSTVERVIDIFPADQQPQIRSQLADCLLLVLSQRLVRKKDGTGLALAYEKLTNTLKIRNFIREGKTHQIRSQMLLPGEEYSSIDVSLAQLCLEGRITQEEGLKHCDNASFYREMVKSKNIRTEEVRGATRK